MAPAADGSYVVQSDAVQKFLTFGTFGVEALAMVVVTIIFVMFNLEKKLPDLQKEIKSRRNSAE